MIGVVPLSCWVTELGVDPKDPRPISVLFVPCFPPSLSLPEGVSL